MTMTRRIVLLGVAMAIMFGGTACRYDYFFLAFEIECCFPEREWNSIYCIDFPQSPFEILAGPYKFEFDVDIPSGMEVMPFPKKLQPELVGYDAAGGMLFRERFKRFKFNRQTGRLEETPEIRNERVIPAGGRLCVNARTFGGELMPGWKAGVLVEPL